MRGAKVPSIASCYEKIIWKKCHQFQNCIMLWKKEFKNCHHFQNARGRRSRALYHVMKKKIKKFVSLSEKVRGRRSRAPHQVMKKYYQFQKARGRRSRAPHYVMKKELLWVSECEGPEVPSTASCYEKRNFKFSHSEGPKVPSTTSC